MEDNTRKHYMLIGAKTGPEGLPFDIDVESFFACLLSDDGSGALQEGHFINSDGLQKIGAAVDNGHGQIILKPGDEGEIRLQKQAQDIYVGSHIGTKSDAANSSGLISCKLLEISSEQYFYIAIAFRMLIERT